MTAARVPGFLRRYTDLPALLHLLRRRELTLLDPRTWDDRNDAHFMALYKARRELKTVLALCFSQSQETYHHWRVFSSGAAGVCIVFDRERLLQDLHVQPGIRTGAMTYLTLPQLRGRPLQLDELPVLNRYGFKPETEFRAVYCDGDEERPSLAVPIRLASIRSISLSPWMHGALAESAVQTLRAIEGCARLRVSRSTLISNEQWKRYGSGAA